MSFMVNHLAQNYLFIAKATEDQVPKVTEIINDAFWPSHKVFLDESNVLSKLRVTSEFIREAIGSHDKELYLLNLSDSIDNEILGIILLQKDIENDPYTAKFDLLSRNFTSINKDLRVGDLLIAHVINRAQKLGKMLLKIDVVDSGENANPLLAYYERKGFIRTGKVLGFPRQHCVKPNYKDRVCLIELQLVILKHRL